MFSDNNFSEQKRMLSEKHSAEIENISKNEQVLWQHLAMVNATILGFGVAITQMANLTNLSEWVPLSWLSLILSILVAPFLHLADQGAREILAEDSFRNAYNLNEIFLRESKLKISPEDAERLLEANMYDTHWFHKYPERSGLQEWEIGKIKVSQKELRGFGYALYVEPNKLSQWWGFKRWLSEFEDKLLFLFYLLSSLSYAFLILSILFGPYFFKTKLS